MRDFLKQNQRFWIITSCRLSETKPKVLNNQALPTPCRIQVWTYSALLLPKKLNFHQHFLNFDQTFPLIAVYLGNLQIFFTSTCSINGYGQYTEFWASESRFWAPGSQFWTSGSQCWALDLQKSIFGLTANLGYYDSILGLWELIMSLDKSIFGLCVSIQGLWVSILGL